MVRVPTVLLYGRERPYFRDVPTMLLLLCSRDVPTRPGYCWDLPTVLLHNRSACQLNCLVGTCVPTVILYSRGIPTGLPYSRELI